jgi:Na+/proline symporter
MSQNIGGKYVAKKKDPLKPFYAIIGLVIMVAAAAIGYFAAPTIIDSVWQYLPPEIRDIPADQLRIIFAAAIFFIVVGFLGFVFAIFAPRPPKGVSERELSVERKNKDKERRRMKKRRSAMRKRMKESTEDMDDL